MDRQQGFAHLILILVIIVIAIIGYLVFTKKLPIGQSASSSSDSQSLLKTEYQNPFDEKASYSNPFSGYQNPFDNLAQ